MAGTPRNSRSPRTRGGLPVLTLTLALAALGPALAGCADDPPEADPMDGPDVFAGTWVGTMSTPGGDLEMRVNLAVADGVVSAEVFSVTQGNAQIPVESATVRSWTATTPTDQATPQQIRDLDQEPGMSISIAMPVIGASYHGVLSADGARIEGTFTQGGAELALDLVPGSADEALRPQNPVEPYPYQAEDVQYVNPDGGHTLAGTFTRPEEGGPFPAVVLITGSGPQDRNEALMGHKPFLVLADHLTRRGIAVLRYDDRGVGESTGDFASAISTDFASDALAGVAYLRTRHDVDAGAIGLAGHSEGGLVAPIAAVESEDVTFIVLMAGTGVTGEEILYAQGALIAQASGASDEAVASNRELQAAMFEVLKAEDDIEAAAERLEPMIRASLEGQSEADLAQAGITDEASMDQVISTQIDQFNTPWFRYFLTYDPAPTIERVTVPVLAINGEKDLQVPWEENLGEIEAALRRGGNDSYEIHALPDLNHLFQHSETGSPAEYGTIEETWAEHAMELIAEWVLRVTGR